MLSYCSQSNDVWLQQEETWFWKAAQFRGCSAYYEFVNLCGFFHYFYFCLCHLISWKNCLELLFFVLWAWEMTLSYVDIYRLMKEKLLLLTRRHHADERLRSFPSANLWLVIKDSVPHRPERLSFPSNKEMWKWHTSVPQQSRGK